MRRGVIELICEQFEAGQCGPIAHSIAGLPAKEIELFLSEFALTVGTGVAIKALAFIRDFDECDVDDATIQLVGRAVGPHFLHDDLADVQRMDEFYSPLLDILNSERYGTRARNFSVCVIWRHLERAGIDTFVGILKNCSLTHTEAVMSAFMDSIDGLIMRSAASEMQDGWTPSSALPLLAVLVKIVQLHKAKVAGTSTHTDNMCKYILEYAKDNARPQDVRQRSLQLVALQVCYGHASPLLSHLAQWPPADTARFVTDLVDIVPHTEANLVSSKDGSFLSIKAALLDDPAHPYGLVYRKHHIYALIEFHSQLIQLNEPTCRAVLDTGYLDVVLGLCMRGNVRAKCPFASCDLALQKCASYGDMYRGMIVGHPLFHLWPSWVPFSLRPAAKDIDVQARASAWRRVDARDVYWHHSQIRSLVDENFWDPPPTNELELFEYCLDLFEFSRREFYGDIAGHADRVLRMFVREPKHEDAYTKACKAMKVQPALAYLFQRNNPLPSEPRIPSTLEVHPSAILA
ncbi:hypothetical protein PLICRDRAFT_701721 [Plicaturopsis crispa FD-325 SS-3]|uniref:Uncharacterized protein n=1 Tax=Plicaturopsis crispa FD-325 SS-3 TaxID=944288 RepID=A0A0C9SRC1_PLICR|nr:hypothetical protein PLICRDRAFT_701721 [Plicaturopsis crispa FD-325 SS-3]